VLLDDRPPAVLVGEVGRALVHHAGRAVREWSEDDVAVTGDPADVRRAPVHVVVLHIEYELVGRRDAGEIPGCRVHDALWLRGRPRRVEEIEHVLALERFGRALRLLAVDDLVPPDVASLAPRHLLLRAADDQDFLDALRLSDRVVGVLLEWDDAALAIAAVRRDEDLRLRVID